MACWVEQEAESGQTSGCYFFVTGCGETLYVPPFPIFNMRAVLAKIVKTNGSAGALADRQRTYLGSLL